MMRVTGAYYEALMRDGTPILTPPGTSPNDAIGTPYGEKSMNTHIHLLESLTALYKVWPDSMLRARLQEVFHLVRDRIAAPSGYLNMFFKPDWTAVSNTDSYGHDLETAYLLTEAASALGQPNDPQTWATARRLVDHALRYGWDAQYSGVFDQGTANGAATQMEKVWWEQAEALNAFLLMHERYGRATTRYWTAFVHEWTFIRDHQVDAQHGGWYKSVSRDGSPIPGQGKSDSWTDPYHQGRALLNVTNRLDDLALKKSASK